MAFKHRNLSVLAYANGYTMWHYNAAGEKEGATREIGFFYEVADMIRPGDTMFVSLDAGTQGQILVFSGEGKKLTGNEFTRSTQSVEGSAVA